MPKQATGKTGSASVEKQGQTTDQKYGSDPYRRTKYKGKTTELKPKG